MDSEFKVVSSLLKRESRKGSYEEGEGPQRGYAAVALIDLLEPFADVEPDPCAWGGAELGLVADDNGQPSGSDAEDEDGSEGGGEQESGDEDV